MVGQARGLELTKGARDLLRVGWDWVLGGVLAGLGTLLGLVCLFTHKETIKLLWLWDVSPIAGLAIASIVISIAALWAYAGLRQHNAKKAASVTAATAAKVLLEQETLHRREESFRVGVIKLISLFIGIALAFWLQIDAVNLLEGVLSKKVIGTINKTFISIEIESSSASDASSQAEETSEATKRRLDLTVGIVLTGLAATAGSAFWHDQLDRLQSIKRQAESAAKVVQSVGSTAGGTEEST
ncbi:MAG: hypothetical protein JXA89_19940 [Anaerolineae bacterium]|nr:hypothetical protein [Anaerolineae bacterium]